MKEQKHEIERMEVRYFDERGGEHFHVPTQRLLTEEGWKMRLSIWIDTDDSHHIEIKPNEDRYRLSGLLVRLAQSVAEGV